MRDEDPACEVVCHFCHSKYQYDLNDLLAEYDAQAAERAAAEQGLDKPLKKQLYYKQKRRCPQWSASLRLRSQ